MTTDTATHLFPGTTTSRPPAADTEPPSVERADALRRVSLAAGLLYLLTFAASIPQLKLFANLVDHPERYVAGAYGRTPVLVGVWLELVTAAANVGTAVVLYRVARRVSRTAAVGFVTSRVVESTLIVVGALCVLTVTTLRSDPAGANAGALAVTAHALVTMRQWTFVLGPSLIAGINALFLGYVMYRSRLVPRPIPTVGLVGAPILLFSATANVFGLWGQTSSAGMLCALPVAAWEFSLGTWLTVKGFRPAAVRALGHGDCGPRA